MPIVGRRWLGAIARLISRIDGSRDRRKCVVAEKDLWLDADRPRIALARGHREDQPVIRTTRAAIARPMGSEEVAAGDGALQTCT
jgi:hypothetical protein